MDRDTLQDDLDLILELSRDDELPGEWDWEPPLGTIAPTARTAAGPEETDAEASGDAEDGTTDDDDEDEED